MPFQFQWLHGQIDDPVEAATFAVLKIVLSDQILTRLYDRIAGGERDSINVSLHPLALAIAKNWWSLLYEPRKSDENDISAEARHSLDAYMAGFVFPSLSIWSSGNDTIAFETPDVPQEFSTLKFMPPSTPVTQLRRQVVEQNLFELVNAVVERLKELGAAFELRDLWSHILQTLADEEERKYCIAAGKLGLNPYDPDATDITQVAQRISDRLFSDVCEAARPEELTDATEWARESTQHFDESPRIDISALGPATTRSPEIKIWDHGYQAARTLRRALRLENDTPRRAVDRIFGGAVARNVPTLHGAHPFSLKGVTDRRGDEMRVVLPNVSARMRRSTLCRSLYVAWRTANGDSSAVTTASTLDQQASRAFAAELLAPAEQLMERAGTNGLTEDDIEKIADENICPEQMIIWNAHNHNVPLRGVMLPTQYQL